MPDGALLVAIVVAVLLFVLWVRTYSGLRLGMAIIGHSLLWMRIRGQENVPATGPVLLISPPVSYLGWLMLLVACPRRVRFVILGGWTETGLVGLLLRRAGAITTSGSDHAAIEQALIRAGEALSQGEVVCLFTEGCRTRDGQTLLFPKLYEQIVGHRRVPIVPVCPQQPHGSIFGMHKGKFVRKIPAEILSPVWIRFGPALPVGTPAAQARQALQELSAKLAIERNPHRRPVHRQFVRMAARHPFRACWIDSSAPGQDMTYAKAYVGAVCLRSLLKPVVGASPMVAIWLPPGRGSALANIALAMLGKTSVNLNYTAATDSIQSALKQCDCKHVLTARRFTARLPLDPGPGVELIYLDDLLPKVGRFQKLCVLLSVILLPGWLLEYVRLGLGRHRIEDLATIIFSSGSTGDPKGVMLTHGNVASNAEAMIQATQLNPDDRILGVLPFFHSFGYTVALWAPLQIGASAVYHADPRQAREIGELCKTHRCTIYVSTATFLRYCLRKCDPDHFSTIRILMCGAEKLPPALAQEFEKRFGVLPLEGYGCTELSPAAAANMPDQVFGDLVQVHNKGGTVGPPLPGCAARTIHPDTHEPLPLGEEGLLLVTGANVMKGYLHKPDLTSRVILDGWYVTGDMARVDAEGHITLTGRLSRFAKIAGEMVPLERVEEALHDALDTSERVCAVTCVPDEMRGERVLVLYVQALLAPFGLGVRPWCAKLTEQGLPNLWVPAERDFHPVEELPVLGSGKVNLKGVKDLALSLVRKVNACRMVLVRTEIAANIGSVARAMSNLGVSDLVLVAPKGDPRSKSAEQLATTHGLPLLHRARIVESLDEALADCVLAAATSARTGGLFRRQTVGPPEKIAEHLVEAMPAGRVALVFGPEPHGLSNDEVVRCSHLIHIATEAECPALNLAQAVAICLYEVRRVRLAREGAVEVAPVATLEEQRRMFERLEQGLQEIRYLRGDRGEALMHALRHLISRARPSPMEVNLLIGLARQLRWIARQE